jgi:hypothetical protein
VNVVDYLAGQHEHDEGKQGQQDAENPAANQNLGKRVEEVSG